MSITEEDVSHMGDDDEAYDYKFVKWMIKEKVNYTSLFDVYPSQAGGYNTPIYDC